MTPRRKSLEERLAEAAWSFNLDTYAVRASRGDWVAYAWSVFIAQAMWDTALMDDGRLAVCGPPRHGKSTTASDQLPKCYLHWFPRHHVILAGHSDKFAAKWGRKVRDFFLDPDSPTTTRLGKKRLETEFEKRHLIRLLYRLIIKTGCTTVAITDIPWNSDRIGESIEEFVADGIILMEHNYDEAGSLTRRLRVTKMRGTNHSRKTHPYMINEKGLEIQI